MAENVTGHLTVAQAAVRAKVANGTVYRWLAEGRLTKYGNRAGRVYVDPVELDDLTRIEVVDTGAPVVTGATS